MEKTVFLIVFAVQILEISSLKVKERFKNVPPNYPWRVGIAYELPQSYSDFSKVSVAGFKGFNCSRKICGKEGNGNLVDPVNGTYNGLIGCVQRDEIDMFYQVVRPDSTPFEPGHFVTFSEMDDSPRIFARESTALDSSTVNILYFLTNFSSDIWFYFIITLEISLIFFIISLQMLEKRIWRKLRTFKRFFPKVIIFHYDWFYKYLMLFLDVGEESLGVFKFILSVKVLYFLIGIAMWHSIQHVVMNTLSSDLTVTGSTRVVDTLRELLFDDDFRKMIPTIFSHLNMVNLLSRTINGTIENDLFKRILHFNSIVYPNTRDSQGSITEALEANSKVANGTIALIESYDPTYKMERYVYCHLAPDTTSKMRASKEVILPSATSMLVTKSVPKEVLKLFHYRLQTISEFKQIEAMFRIHFEGVSERLLGPPYDPAATQYCINKWDGIIEENVIDAPWQPFDITPFIKMIEICLLLWFISLICLIAEKFVSEISHYLQE